MRLLKVGTRGELCLTKNWVADVPRYAILSHTWGTDDEEEVTFDDLQNGSCTSKAGYAKIQFCGKQAMKDGLQYCWVDTCCIDKANHTELSEAITSMFRWYRDAEKCYVYLSDVSVDSSSCETGRTWKADFQESRWFTRGWTLQELLAPKAVEFFSQEEARLGDKLSLALQIHDITQIPIAALYGASLSNFGHDERLRWAEKRETKRLEDKAYCLLGIFDVSMSPRYGEGDKAFIRLKKKIDRASQQPSWQQPQQQQQGYGQPQEGYQSPLPVNNLYQSQYQPQHQPPNQYGQQQYQQQPGGNGPPQVPGPQPASGVGQYQSYPQLQPYPSPYQQPQYLSTGYGQPSYAGASQIQGSLLAQQQYSPGAHLLQSLGQNFGVYKQLLQNTIQENHLQNFYPLNSPELDQIANRASSQVQILAHQWRVHPEIAQDIVKLALYDIILYVDDSGSMVFEENGERIDDLKLIIDRVAFAVGLFDNNGINVRFMNSTTQGNSIKTRQQVEQLISQVRFRGLTPLGRELQNKVLQPLVIGAARAGQLRKPVLVITIIDGQPTGELQRDISNIILCASRELQSHPRYGKGALAFQFAQVGNDIKAREFLKQLDENTDISDIIDCTSNFEVEQDEMSRAVPPVNLTPELWLIKLLLGSIDRSYNGRDESTQTGTQGCYGSPLPGQGHGVRLQGQYGQKQGGYSPQGGYPLQQHGGYSAPQRYPQSGW